MTIMMKPPLNADMMEATRLTREGRLMEATALLQRALRGESVDPVPEGTGERDGQEREQVFMREEFAMVLGGFARRAPPQELRR